MRVLLCCFYRNKERVFVDQNDFYKERDLKGFDTWSDDYIAEISIRVLSDLHSRTCIEYDNLEIKNDERKKNYFKDLMELFQ